MMKNVKKSTILSMLLSVPILALSAFIWTSSTPDAGAFSGASNAAGSCTTCHNFGPGFGPEHTTHVGRGTACGTCHTVSTAVPPTTSVCAGCHVNLGKVALAGFHSTVGVTTCITCHPATTAEICNNGIDDDSDGLIDCNDPNCQTDPACAANAEICNDGIDNDGNGFMDCADSACATNPACVAPKETNCSDSIDNDGDGKIDCADSDCASKPACTTSGPPSDHTDVVKGVAHKPGKGDPTKTGCTACHGADLKGGIVGVSCYTCHGRVWAQNGLVPVSHTKKEDGAKHKPGLEYPIKNKCTDCHGANLRGSSFASSCYKCHGKEWEGGGKNGNNGCGGYNDRDKNKKQNKHDD